MPEQPSLRYHYGHAALTLFMAAALTISSFVVVHMLTGNEWVGPKRDLDGVGLRGNAVFGTQSAVAVQSLGSGGKVAVPFGDSTALQAILDRNLSSLYLEKGIVQGPQKPRKRAEVTWQKALDDGQRMIDLLRGDRQPSPWNDESQLKDNGWSTNILGQDDGVTDELDKAGGPFQSLRIKQEDGRIIYVQQSLEYDNACYDDLEPTRGEYDQVYNIPSRTIVGIRNDSPLSKLATIHPDAQQRLPFLNKWSDLTWIVWAAAAGTRTLGPPSNALVRDNLKYIFKNHIITYRTMETMNAVFPRVGSNSDANMDTEFEQAWPGTTFDAGSLGFQALLGTPHGKGVVFLV
ncbi:MAG: hypothetical protein Q9222_006911, partial [Ikaeria aurantiellina]